MFKLAIIDDEDFIKEELATIIDWNNMGFNVVETFDDAWDIINKIKEFDVILSDIKMPNMTGIDLAKYIYEKKISTKLILISAFGEFELAKKAINYGVSAYLTKPVDLDELREILRKIVSELWINVDEFNKKREYFYHNLILGSLTKESIANSNILESTLDFQKSTCRVVEIKINDYNDYVDKVWEYDKGSLANAICKFFDFEGEFLCRPLICVNDRLFLLVAKDFVLTERFFKNTITEINDLIELELEIINFKEFKNIYTLAEANILFDDTQVLIKERGKLLFTMISTGEVDAAVKLAKSLVSQNENFLTIMRDINRTMLNYGKDTTLLQRYATNDVEKWTKEACKLFSIDKTNETDVVEKIKDYIKKNYMLNISLEELSQTVYLNPVYLSQLFKAKTGETFSIFLLKVRMEMAKELLGDIQYKVYDVGEMVGYKSMKHFYKLFKNYTSFTPTEYRKANNCKIINEKGI